MLIDRFMKMAKAWGLNPGQSRQGITLDHPSLGRLQVSTPAQAVRAVSGRNTNVSALAPLDKAYIKEGLKVAREKREPRLLALPKSLATVEVYPTGEVLLIVSENFCQMIGEESDL